MFTGVPSVHSFFIDSFCGLFFKEFLQILNPGIPLWIPTTALSGISLIIPSEEFDLKIFSGNLENSQNEVMKDFPKKILEKNPDGNSWKIFRTYLAGNPGSFSKDAGLLQQRGFVPRI